MPFCIHDGCEVNSPKKILGDGYCAKHSEAQKNVIKELLHRVSVLEADNTSLKKDNATMKDANAALKTALNQANGEIYSLVKNVNSLQSSLNISNYQRDEIEQYGRLESFRYIDIPEETLQTNDKGEIIETEDCFNLAIKASEMMGVSLKKKNIQRAHRIGRRRIPRRNTNGVMEEPKPRQVIVKLKDYSKRTEIIVNKKQLKLNAVKNKCEQFENAFIVEDLTPLRSKLLWYAKKQCNGKFKNCHTRDGRIKAQKTDDDEWVTISNPDDFHKHGVDINIDIINKGLKKVQILKDLSLPDLSYFATA